ncbi:18419_t:CDS:2 [Acaulospora morrowiae]|uniref:18419_t:CDS:1 n=1 Tax=Acaulospora morrowiae TaxID=94023 RepID=A0A9N9GPT8_9GLOM|nr:18419_t:CDS:2 [Acaulospora morrowiae]
MDEQYNDQESDVKTFTNEEDIQMNPNQINVVDPRNLEEAITGAKRIEAREYYEMTIEKETKITSLEETIAELIKQMQNLTCKKKGHYARDCVAGKTNSRNDLSTQMTEQETKARFVKMLEQEDEIYYTTRRYRPYNCTKDNSGTKPE